MPRTALIAVDVQNDYQPGGALGFADSDNIIEPLIEYATLAADIVIASRNVHPPDHESFEPAGKWPPNCIKGTAGARIVSDLATIAVLSKNYVITKGITSSQGGFSAFEAGTLRPLESLENILRREEITHVAVAGYWLEYCVAQTAFDACALGYLTAIEGSCTVDYPEYDVAKRGTLLTQLSRAGVVYT